jgi:hypothetical protein
MVDNRLCDLRVARNNEAVRSACEQLAGGTHMPKEERTGGGGDPTLKVTLRYVPQSHVIPQASRCNRERCIAAPSSGARSQPRHLINAGRSLPIENVNHLPRVPNEIYLQLPLLIDLELGCGVEHTRALALVRVVQI